MKQSKEELSGQTSSEYTRNLKDLHFLNKNRKTMLQPNKDERDYILTNLSSNAYILYETYINRSKRASYADEDIQKVLHFWSVQTIARARKQLIQAGFFYPEKHYTPKGKVKLIVNGLGKPGVSNASAIKRTEAAKANTTKRKIK